jgi:ATP-binding cassette, subfamily C (CFTR/MRP), member 1
VTNLVAVDMQKLFNACPEVHNVWSYPLLIVVAIIMLIILIGAEMALGLAVLIRFLSLVQKIVERVLRIRKERFRLTDVRIGRLSAAVDGIRVTKLNHYERHVEAQLDHVRKQETLLSLRKELWMWGWVLTSVDSSPVCWRSWSRFPFIIWPTRAT